MPVRTGKYPVRLVLGFQIDRTGSSLEFEKGIAAASGIVLKAVQETVQQVVVSVGTHGDLDCGERYMSLVGQATPDEALEAIRGIRYEGGGDAEETHGDGIETALESMAWSSDPMSRNVLAVFLTADSKDMKDGMSFADLGKRFVTRRIKLVVVCQPTARLRELCENAQGQMIEMSNDPSEDELRKVAKILTKTLTIVATTGKTVPLQSASVA